MSDFDSSEWREVDVERRVAGIPHRVEYDDRGYPTRWWIREEPMPPLPTKPFTVIRVTPKSGDLACFGLGDDKWWHLLERDSVRWAPSKLRKIITGFEVLSAPIASPFQWEKPEVVAERTRRETVQKVTDWFAKHLPLTAALYDETLREFGVKE